jgi:cytoskeletal protein CcmA (bactofilin family)
MFHKQNIPESGPPTQNNNTSTTEEKPVATGENTMDDVQQESKFMANNPFQRPTTQATAYGTAETPTTSEGRKLIIGQGITMSGEIENCDQLLVEGTVEATLNGAKLLDIAESGIFYGSVDIEEAIIAGRFEGDLTVDGRVTITSTGTVTGTITYRELTVEAGANIEGKISSFASSSNKSEAATADFSKLKAASKKSSETNKKADAA